MEHPETNQVVRFLSDSSKVSQSSQSNLDSVVDTLNKYPMATVVVSGHTDATGSEKYNQRVSEQRAASVENYLVEQGVESERIATVGKGETQPAADNKTKEGRELNRRVELTIPAFEYEVIE